MLSTILGVLHRSLRALTRTTLGALLARAVDLRYALRPATSRRSTPRRTATAPAPPIDAVYTWVDDGDPAWLARKQRYLAASGNDPAAPAATHQTRFHNRDELRYSLRSLARHAGFINRVWVVTDQQVPAWLKRDNPRLSIVDHRDIFPARDLLPTFNSHAIESRLHHIDGLAERFVYLNDDFFLARDVSPEDFFTTDGKAITWLAADTIDPTLPAPGDSTLVWAAKNNYRLLSTLGPQPPLHKPLHAPYALLRSVLDELEQSFADEFRRTAASRFRSRNDIAVASSLFQHYAARTARGELRGPNDPRMPACYINVASPFLRARLRYILHACPYRVFCINEPVSADLDTARFDAIVRNFLETFYPHTSPFEIER